MEPTSPGEVWDKCRRLLGCVLLPPSAAAVGLATYDGLWHLGLLPNGSPIHSLDAAESLGLGITVLAVVMLGAVLPGIAWLNRTGRLSIRPLLVLGAALGNGPLGLIVAVVALVAIQRGESMPDIGRNWEGPGGALIRIVLGSTTGMGSALVYWLVAVVGAGKSDRP